MGFVIGEEGSLKNLIGLDVGDRPLFVQVRFFALVLSPSIWAAALIAIMPKRADLDLFGLCFLVVVMVMM